MADTTTARVPAWKRLGLKLKFAQESPLTAAPVKTPSTTTASPTPQPTFKPITASNPQKRDRDEPSASEAPAKRAKSQSYERPLPIPTRLIVAPEPYVPKRYGFAGISAEPTGKRTVFDDEDTPLITAAPISTEESDEPVAKKIRPSTLRKSVSFTPDTKLKDGETGQKYFKAWASGEDPTAINPSVEEPTSPSKSSTDSTEKPVKKSKQKKAKKPKKSKSTTIDSKSSTSTSAAAEAEATGEVVTGERPAFVDYLQLYCSDKGNWKFNKKKQNDLLKNLFNVQRLPVKQDPAIIAYIAGLQGVARDRLAAQAEDVLKSIYQKESGDESDAMALSSPEARKAAYLAALMRHIERCEARGAGRDEYSDEQLNIIREEVQQGRRAQAILEHSLMMELHPEQVVASPTPTATPVPERATRVEKTRRRKRKTRTTGSASSEDSSSSSDESSSDSDGDDSKSPPPARTAIFGKKLLDQAFPKTKKQQPATSASQTKDTDESSDSDDESSDSGAQSAETKRII